MGIMDLAAKAQKQIAAISAEEAVSRKGDGTLVFVDVRDIREVEKSNVSFLYHFAGR